MFFFGRSYVRPLAVFGVILVALAGCAEKSVKAKRSDPPAANAPVAETALAVSSASQDSVDLATEGSSIHAPAGAFDGDVRLSIKSVRDSMPQLDGIAVLSETFEIAVTDGDQKPTEKLILVKPVRIDVDVVTSLVKDVKDLVVFVLTNAGLATETMRVVPNELLLIKELPNGTTQVSFLSDDPNIRYVVAELPKGLPQGAFVSYQVPPNVSALAASSPSETSVTVSWQAADPSVASQTVIAYSEGTEAPADCASGTVVGAREIGTASSHTVPGLDQAKSYSFRVCTVLAAGGPPSLGVTLTAKVGASSDTSTSTTTSTTTASSTGTGTSTSTSTDTDTGVADTTPDTTAPTPGNSGVITTSGITATGATLTWTAATDDVTPVGSLEYKIMRSAANDMATVVNAEARTQVAPFSTYGVKTYAVTGLAPGTTYYFNIVTRDAASTPNKAIYTTVSVTTAADTTNPVAGGATNTTVTSSSVGATSFTLSWAAATDDATATASLQYRVFCKTTDAMASVATVESGTAQNAYTANITTLGVSTGIVASTAYYCNVVVKDAADNKSIYARVSVTTTAPPNWIFPTSAADKFSIGAPDRPAVKVADNDEAVVVWNENYGGNRKMYLAFYDGTTWTKPATSNDYFAADIFLETPVIHTNNAGTWLVLFRGYDGMGDAQTFAYVRSAGAWVGPTMLRNNGDGRFVGMRINLGAAVRANGSAIVVLQNWDNDKVYLAEYDPTGGWTLPAAATHIGIPAFLAGYERGFVMLPNGTGVLGHYKQEEDTFNAQMLFDVFASTYVGSTWTHPASYAADALHSIVFPTSSAWNGSQLRIYQDSGTHVGMFYYAADSYYKTIFDGSAWTTTELTGYDSSLGMPTGKYLLSAYKNDTYATFYNDSTQFMGCAPPTFSGTNMGQMYSLVLNADASVQMMYCNESDSTPEDFSFIVSKVNGSWSTTQVPAGYVGGYQASVDVNGAGNAAVAVIVSADLYVFTLGSFD